MKRTTFPGWLLIASCGAPVPGGPPAEALRVLHHTVDLAVGETREIALTDGKAVRITLKDLHETRDSLRNAVRSARVKVILNGTEVEIESANYTLPVAAAGAQIDCPVTRGYYENTDVDRWGLTPGKDARLRIWPAGSPLVEPGTFTYPVKQRWFAGGTQMGNEPVYVDGPENLAVRKIYYHSGLDIGAAEGLTEVVAAAAGRVIAAGDEKVPGEEPRPVIDDYSVLLVDARGWCYWYAHLKTIDVKPGQQVRLGQRLGLVGKEGGSGGWSHLHFEIKSRRPSGPWGTEEGYAFLWEAYVREHAPPLLAVARPHRLAKPGETVLLDGSKSRSFSGEIARYRWILSGGAEATSPRVERTYARPGTYSEVLEVTDSKGNRDYDFCVVQILEPGKKNPPAINASYAPTFGLRPGDPVTFRVRSFWSRPTGETWDFGDGTPPVQARSDANQNPHAPDGYAETVHRYERAGHYLVRVEHTGPTGDKAAAHLHVRVGDMIK